MRTNERVRQLDENGLYAFRLWGLLSPGEPRVEAEVIDQIRVAIETRSNEE